MESLEMNLNNKLENTLEKNQRNFLETSLGKTINSAIDIGLKAALPNLVEDQIINIKNTILEQGFSEGIKEVINTGLDYGKSITGIVTGDFENISQIQMAIKKGGILDNISKLLDLSINFAKSKNLITPDIANLIKRSKNTVITSVSEKIENNLTNQIKSIEKLEKYCEKWNEAYNERDFSEMEKAYKNIKGNLNKIIPFEKIIDESRKIENLHNLIKNNGNNFNLSEEEKSLALKI